MYFFFLIPLTNFALSSFNPSLNSEKRTLLLVLHIWKLVPSSSYVTVPSGGQFSQRYSMVPSTSQHCPASPRHSFRSPVILSGTQLLAAPNSVKKSLTFPKHHVLFFFFNFPYLLNLIYFNINQWLSFQSSFSFQFSLTMSNLDQWFLTVLSGFQRCLTFSNSSQWCIFSSLAPNSG